MVKNKIRIAHLSDIHVKDDRRGEYKKIFTKLYSCLSSEKIDTIAITGDIFHDKTRASANNYTDVKEFLTQLTKIAPVVLIPGNHDLNIKVANSPDLISPVVTNHQVLKEPQFFY
jgi:predicted MPP superfamily phosphohydrolase